jgi:hypothetical protein
LQDKFLKVLTEAQRERPNKQKWINNELEWVTYEREEMYKAVKSMRDIPLEEVEKAEIHACGHVDYSRKFALYCAELVAYGKMHMEG